ncbi:TPA: transporter substrate-binding domain-containing protein [Aeromonas veronii]|nr:transporter substrate-binding domain-containing protein [Aeromonas veronii]
MKINIKINVIMVFLVFLTPFSSMAINTSQSEMTTNVIKLLSREEPFDYDNPRPFFSEEQKKWLQDRKKLVLAIVKSDNPPMSFMRSPGVYEGVTADIVGIIANILKVEIIGKEYSSYEDAVQAVKSGKADFIGEANGYDINTGLILTNPYISGEPGIYKRFDVNDIKTVAIVEYYLPFSEVIKYTPRAKINVYPSRKSAIASVAYGKSDAALVDLLSGNYIVNSMYSDLIKLGSPVHASNKGFSFAVGKHNHLLIDILNAALGAASSEHINNIVKRWNGGGLSLQFKGLQLNNNEWKWLHDNKRITVALQTNMPPLSYIDLKGSLHGLVIDILQVLETKLGVNFTILPVKNTIEQVAVVESGVADLMIMSPTEDRRRAYSFTSAFVVDPLVYVLHKKNKDIDPYTLLRTGRVATINGFISTLKIDQYFQHSQSISFSQVNGALDCVTNELCDIVILPLRVARFLIETKYQDSLIISGDAFESRPVAATFAAKTSHKELVAIIDKALVSIPPDEIARLATSWRVNAKNELLTILDVLFKFKFAIISAFVVLLLAVIWGGVLWRQMSRRKTAEVALENQLRFMEELIDSTPHPIYALDIAGSHTLCNDSYADFFEMEKSDIVGTNLSSFVEKNSYMSEARVLVIKTLQDGQPRCSDLCFKLPNGKMDIYYWTHPYRDSLGVLRGCVGGWIDISERVALLSELTETSKAKSTFLATMSHEIRTPMNAIIGMLELTLRKDNLDSNVQKSIAIAYQSSQDLLALIGDILDISKIESGRLEITPSSHHISELTTPIIDVFSASAHRNGLGLKLKLNDDAMVMVDPIRYKQIISNLLSNAIKFSRSGDIELTISLKSAESLCEVSIQVSDNGIGISQEDISKLFEPFSQGKQPMDMEQSGTGLGLFICRTLCRMMGGDLILESKIGVGTTVTAFLRLPLLEALSNKGINEYKNIDNIDTEIFKILVVDDHPVNCILVSQQLEYLGYEVDTVLSGREALAKLEHQSYNFIITDLNMPEMDGLEFARLYRKQEANKNNRTVIIGLTADARQIQIESAIQAGMDDCLFKPINIDQLDSCINIHRIMIENISPAEMASKIKHALNVSTSGRGDVVKSMLIAFERSSNEDIENLCLANQERDCKAFLKYLSRLKDASNIIGAESLAQCCSEWERSQRITWCMLSALRQIQIKYLQVQAGIRILLDIS